MKTLTTLNSWVTISIHDKEQTLSLVSSSYTNGNIALQLINTITEAAIECTIDIPALELLEHECLIPETKQDIMQALINAGLIQPTELTPIYTRQGHRARVCRVHSDLLEQRLLEQTRHFVYC
ncbi:hypothetical protein AB3R30_07160 [Leptolyngbyaceae cyanobacterium UHCC 1019]